MIKKRQTFSVEWDENKEKENKRKHGLSFMTASLVFADVNRIEIYDKEHSDTEDRYRTIGMVKGIVTVIYTVRESDIIRIISARPATKDEEARYHGYC